MSFSRARGWRSVRLAVFGVACLTATVWLFWRAGHTVRLSGPEGP